MIEAKSQLTSYNCIIDFIAAHHQLNFYDRVYIIGRLLQLFLHVDAFLYFVLTCTFQTSNKDQLVIVIYTISNRLFYIFVGLRLHLHQRLFNSWKSGHNFLPHVWWINTWLRYLKCWSYSNQIKLGISNSNSTYMAS